MFGKKLGAFVAVGLMLGCVIGCAAKAPVMREGKQVEVSVLVDRGIKDGMKDEERESRNEMGQFMEEDLVEMLNHEGYKALLASKTEQYPLGPTQFLLSVRIKDLHSVSGGTRFWVGAMAGSSWVESHFELSGLGKTFFAYDERRDSVRDWKVSPHELNEGVVTKTNEQLNVNTK